MIPEGWNTYNLSDLIILIGGGTPKTGVPDYWNGDIPWLSVVDFNSGNKHVFSTEKSITEKGLQESATKILKKGQIIISARGTVGEMAMLGRDMAFNQSCYGIDANQKTNNDFLFYLLKSSIQRIKKKTHGAVFDTITKQTFENISVIIPTDISEQSRIASILSSLDDKIELNLQMNKTLEAIAQAIFKEWFVDFRFPGFDGELVDGIPKGWRKVELGEICETTDFVANGSFASLKENVHLLDEEDYAIYVRTTDFNNGFDNGLKYVDKDSYDFLKKSRLFGNEVIISNVGDVGTVFRPPVWLNKPMTLGSNAVMITESFYNNYLFYFLSSEIGQHLIDGIISGSAQPKFNKTAFRNLELVIPSKVIIENFNTLINSIIFILNLNNANSRTLIQMRNGLLPQLMTGKIRVA